MNSKAALIKALLSGETVSIMSGFKTLGITNVPREIGRCVERPFGVIVSRLPKEGTTRYGVSCSWMEYRLNPLIDGNAEGIKKMAEYLLANDPSAAPKAGLKIEHKDAASSTKQASPAPVIPEKQSNQIYTEQSFSFPE